MMTGVAGLCTDPGDVRGAFPLLNALASVMILSNGILSRPSPSVLNLHSQQPSSTDCFLQHRPPRGIIAALRLKQYNGCSPSNYFFLKKHVRIHGYNIVSSFLYMHFVKAISYNRNFSLLINYKPLY